jgi:hypothetical protein
MGNVFAAGGNFNAVPAFNVQIPASGTYTISSANLWTVPAGCSYATYNFTVSGVVVLQGVLYVANTFTLSNQMLFQGGTLVIA